jgi:hypothetical protein
MLALRVPWALRALLVLPVRLVPPAPRVPLVLRRQVQPLPGRIPSP